MHMTSCNPESVKGKTLTQLEGSDWGESQLDSYIANACHKLRHKPLGNMTTEDLRMLLGQGIGVKHVMPFALTALEESPLAEGMHFPGDLLCNVLRINGAFYDRNQSLENKLKT